MSYFSNKLKELRKEKNLTQLDLAKMFNITRTGVSYWESDKARPSLEVLYKLCDVFDVTMNELLGDNRTVDVNNIDKDDLERLKSNISTFQYTNFFRTDDMCPKQCLGHQKDHFTFTIKDNSMFPRYQTGDCVIFKKQPKIESGQNAIVQLNKNDITFKKVIKTKDGYILQSLNSKYDSVLVPDNKNFKILGIPCEIRSKTNL